MCFHLGLLISLIYANTYLQVLRERNSSFLYFFFWLEAQQGIFEAKK